MVCGHVAVLESGDDDPEGPRGSKFEAVNGKVIRPEIGAFGIKQLYLEEGERNLQRRRALRRCCEITWGWDLPTPSGQRRSSCLHHGVEHTCLASSFHRATTPCQSVKNSDGQPELMVAKSHVTLRPVRTQQAAALSGGVDNQRVGFLDSSISGESNLLHGFPVRLSASFTLLHAHA